MIARVLWLLIAVLLCGARPILAQQTTALEGTALCQSVAHWFADGYARIARTKQPAVEPYLVLYNGLTDEQTVTITASNGVTLTRTMAAKQRVVVDLWTDVAKRADANFSLDVQFQTYGAADLKMWSGASVVAVAHPLTVCKNTP